MQLLIFGFSFFAAEQLCENYIMKTGVLSRREEKPRGSCTALLELPPEIDFRHSLKNTTLEGSRYSVFPFGNIRSAKRRMLSSCSKTES
jgi:hypothetical protein